MTRQAWYSDYKTSSDETGVSSVYWNGMKSDPIQFLGTAHIPGTPEYVRRYEVGKAVLDKVVKDGERK